MVEVHRTEPGAAITVHVTCADRAEATAIAEHLVGAGLAACVHQRELDSIYTWQGAIERDHEVELKVTTTEARREAVVAAIEERHSYDLPAIGWTALAGTPAYLAWIAEQTAQLR